jgi:hypothetical protein
MHSMEKLITNTLSFSVALALAGMTQLTRAGDIPYPYVGTQNPVTYTFTAANDGNIVGYFAGSAAAFDEQVGLLVNGFLTGSGYGLDNHASNIGDTFDFGAVHAGDALVFVLNLIDPADLGKAYSDPSLNGPYDGNNGGVNHIYSTSATAGQIDASIPAGTYVAFEDLPLFWPPDFNYFDDTFVFTNVATQESVPDGGTTAFMLGSALVALVALRRKYSRA